MQQSKGSILNVMDDFLVENAFVITVWCLQVHECVGENIFPLEVKSAIV